MRVWDLEARRCLRVFKEPRTDVNSVCISPDGRTAYAATGLKRVYLTDCVPGIEFGDNTVRAWNLSDFPPDAGPKERKWFVAPRRGGTKDIEHTNLITGIDLIFEQIRVWIFNEPLEVAPSPASIVGGWTHLWPAALISIAICAFGVWSFRREAPKIAEDL